MNRESWNERYQGTELVWGAGPNRFLAEVAADLPPGRALDLACGEGRNAIWLAGKGWDATGVDFSSTGLDKGRRLAAERGVEVTWIEADVTAWDPHEGYEGYDLIAAMYVHLPPEVRRRVHAGLVSALAPGGSLLVVGHDRTNLTDGFGGPPDPTVLFTPEEIAAELSPLSITRSEQVTRPVETESGPRQAIDTLVLAVRNS